MFSRISIFRMFSVLLALALMLAQATPAYAVSILSKTEGLAGPAPAPEAPSLLQFTSCVHALGFTPQGMYAATGSHALHVDFVNANNVQPQADSPASTSADDKTSPLGRVTYADLWEGVNLTYTANAGSIYTTTYSLAPGADAKNIRLRYNAPLRVDEAGNLRIAFETGEMTESAPIAWQEIDGQRVAVQVTFRLLDSPIQNLKSFDYAQDRSEIPNLKSSMVTFALGKYDPRHALTIDPSVTWNTFLGESTDDWGRAIALDGSGNIYVAGNSYAAWGSPVRDYKSDRDGFAARLDSSGTLIWNTFLGEGGIDAANGIAVDGSGNVYVVGDSSASWTCRDVLGGCTVAAYHGDVDAFAAKLSPSGHLDWNTFMGLPFTDYGTAIAVDTISNPNVVWTAIDKGFWNGAATTFDAEVIKLNLSGGQLDYQLLGAPNSNDYVNAIAVDGSGSVYVAGDSDAPWGSPKRLHQGGTDAFAAKLDSSANLLWNIFLGGTGTDHGNGIAVDGSGNVYVAGESNATWNCLDKLCTVQGHHGGKDTFVAKMDSSGLLGWNTFLGLSGDDSGRGIAVGGGNVYVTGYIWRSDKITPDFDAFATQLSSSGALMANTYLGGSNGWDFGNHIVVSGGDVYVVGDSTATWGSPKHTYKGGFDAFVAKVDFTPPTVNTFIATSPSTSLNIPITAFTASDNTGVTGYLITESSAPPSAGAAGWSGTAPTTYPVGSYGSHTLYPWAKDAAGNVSAVFGTPRTVTVTRVYKLLLPLVVR